MRKTLATKVGLMMAAVAMVAGSVGPAVASQEVAARVPFDFVVGGVRLPAGSYVITQGQGALVSIESTDRRHSAFVLMNAMAADKAGQGARLVFERVGGEHFLSQVVGGGRDGREVLVQTAAPERSTNQASIADVR